MRIGIDDTDSPEGMCTTFIILEILKAFPELDLIGLPRLVRLNPNVPWKTRGNGALSIHLGKGKGEATVVGDLDGSPVYSYTSGLESCPDDSLYRISSIVKANSMIDHEGTDPGIIILETKLPSNLYLRGVQKIIPLKEVISLLKNSGISFQGYGNSRGLIGAACALAWSGKPHTFECIAYRDKSKWGKPRSIEMESVIRMDQIFPTTFNNLDKRNRHISIAPTSPCPILYGIRGTDPEYCMEARKNIKSEPVSRWLLFETNQASDDHIQRKSIRDIKPLESIDTIGIISSKIQDLPGGHVLFTLESGGRIKCAAYEPTKEFRQIVRQLYPGDIIEVVGGIRSYPELTINLEKIQVLDLVEFKKKVSNPKCIGCGRTMKSLGKDIGFRCKSCHMRRREDEAHWETIPRTIHPGWYEVPNCAKRHLHRPLSLRSEIDRVRISENIASDA